LSRANVKKLLFLDEREAVEGNSFLNECEAIFRFHQEREKSLYFSGMRKYLCDKIE
jgi:hypothetical protein